MARRFVDLSVPLEMGIASDPPPILPRIEYHGHEETAAQLTAFFPGLEAEDLPGGEGWAVETLHVSTHNGTHVDAPYHYHSTMDRGARAITIDEVPLEWCFGAGVKFDFRDKPDGHVVSAAEIEAELAPEQQGFAWLSDDREVLVVSSDQPWAVGDRLELPFVGEEPAVARRFPDFFVMSVFAPVHRDGRLIAWLVLLHAEPEGTYSVEDMAGQPPPDGTGRIVRVDDEETAAELARAEEGEKPPRVVAIALERPRGARSEEGAATVPARLAERKVAELAERGVRTVRLAPGQQREIAELLRPWNGHTGLRTPTAIVLTPKGAGRAMSVGVVVAEHLRLYLQR